MTRFIIGLLLGLLLGIAGTTAFLITAGGADYFVTASPRVRELETSLKSAEQDRQWLRPRLGEANDVMARLESRFVALSARFETLATSMEGSPAARALAGTDGEHAAPPPPAAPVPSPSGASSSGKSSSPGSAARALATPTPTPSGA